jgi:ABC-type bacteriocin/lantibiotic exporter with double-glycine peptidase domain
MKEQTQNVSPFKLVVELLFSEAKEVGVIATYQVAVGILSLTIPIGVQAVVNTIAFTQLMQPVIFISLAVLTGQIMGAVLRVIQVIMVEKLQRRLFSYIGMELAFRLPRMSRQVETRLPEMVNRFFDIVTVQKSVSSLIMEGFSLFLQMIIGLLLLAFYHPILLAFDFVLVVCILFILFVLGRGAVKTSVKESKEKYRVAAWLEEISSKRVTFSSKSARFFALERANDFVGEYLTAREFHFKIVLRQVVGFLSLQAFANTALLFIGVWLITKNQLSIGQLVAAEIVVSTVLYSMARFQKHLESYYDLLAALDKISAVMNLPTEKTGGDISLAKGPALIEVRKVEYIYPSYKKVFGPITFTIKPGEKIAIHGSNGSGKSTLLDILYGFKRTTSGAVLFNGDDISSLEPEMYRERVGLVRGIEVVNGPILKNMRLSKPTASLKEIKSVLNTVGILDDIFALPDGLDTLLSDEGSPFSVAQMKRLMLAKALLAEPSLLLVDEAFDGLDDKTKFQVLDVVLSKESSLSVLITSQHPEVEKRCDRIINLDKMSEGGYL